MIFITLGLLALLSSYFLLAYFLSTRTFTTAEVVVNTLEDIFFKGSCFDQTFNFMRETLIRNQTQYTRDAHTPLINQKL
jgi:hypothetical protein